jgi:hypothetical protein
MLASINFRTHDQADATRLLGKSVGAIPGKVTDQRSKQKEKRAEFQPAFQFSSNY